MTFVSLAEHGWIGIVLLLVWLLKQQIKMLAMRLVFAAYRTSHEDQNKWLLKEAQRDDKVALARGFWESRVAPHAEVECAPRRLRAEPTAVASCLATRESPGHPPRSGA